MANEEEGEVRARTFAALRPVCTRLLEVATNQPDECAVVLDALQQVLKRQPVVGLRACMDYVLFPVVLLLDASVACRANKSLRTGHQRLIVGDKVAEGLLACLKLVLESCPCNSVLQVLLQMTSLLKKLTAAAMLSPLEASEEFRHCVVLCLQSLFQALQSCGSSSCSCKHVLLSPFAILKHNVSVLYEGYTFKDDVQEELLAEEFTAVEYSAPEECSLGYLQTLDMAPAIGHLLSLLLQIADREVAQGGIGSGKLREDALSTLRHILVKVAHADALAFFLPGVASGLIKAIRSSMVTSRQKLATATYKSVGAAGNTGALEESVRGLAESLVLVLADARNWSCLPDLVSEHSQEGQDSAEVESALQKVQDVLLQKPEETLHAEVLRESNVEDGAGVKAREGVHPLTMRLERDKRWLESTVLRLGSMLSELLPLLCAHPAPAVRLAVVESTAVLLLTCGGTLENCTYIFLDCLLALSCDEWHHVASAANSSLMFLTSVGEGLKNISGGTDVEVLHRLRCIHRSRLQKQSLLNVLRRLLEKLPQAVFAGNETMAVLQARRLAAAIYFLGPDAIHTFFLESLEACENFVSIMSQCLSFSSSFSGPMNLTSLATSSKSRPLLVMSELKTNAIDEETVSSKLPIQSGRKHERVESIVAAEILPRMPPWLLQSAHRVYKTLACIIRLVGEAAVSGKPGDPALMRIVEILLDTLQQAASVLREQPEEANQSIHFGDGHLQRASATAVCILNEFVYGASGLWTDKLSSFFGAFSTKEAHESGMWGKGSNVDAKSHISECMGNILHDYLSPEIWELPVEAVARSTRKESSLDMSLLHVLQDNALLQQVLVEGIGVFGIALGEAFENGGFLALALYPLLEKLASTNLGVSSAADISLRAICYHSGYQSVKELVIRNSDYVIDSLCRQLRHLPHYPYAPSLLAAILRHTGAAPHLLPLLEEPMHGIVLELEVPARRKHPQLTLPLLRALREIAKAARFEGCAMFAEASSTVARMKSMLEAELDICTEAGQMGIEKLITEVQDTERRRKSVVSVATSCLHACSPLLASQDPETCLLVLDTIEDGVVGLADMEATLPHLQAQRTAIEDFLARSVKDLGDPDDVKPFGSQDEGSQSNILLPSMNKLWPQLVPCLRHTKPAILVRVLAVISSIIHSCGGHFFTRRIANDALPLLLKLLREGPASTVTRPSDNLRPKTSKEILLLKNQGSEVRETGTSPSAVLKVQQAVLTCIQMIAGDKKSSPALDIAYKPIVAWIVGLSCKVQALRAAAAEALVALSNVDSDLVWLLVADLVYGGHTQGLQSPGEEFEIFDQVFPPLPSPKDALWVQYSNHNGDPTIDRRAAQELLIKLEATYNNK